MRRWAAMLMMGIAAASYGAVSPLVKLASQSHVPVSLLTVYQFPVSLLFFSAISAGTRRSYPKPPARRELLLMVLVGLAVAGTGLAYYQSLRRLPASLAIILLFQFSWMLPLLGWAVNRTPPTRRQWLAIIAIVVGTIAAARVRGIGGLSLIGIILGLTAGLAYAFTLFWQGRVREGGSPWRRSLITTIAAGVIVTLVYRPWQAGAGHATDAALLYGSVAGVIGQSLPMVLTYMSAPSLGPVLTAILAAVELPVAVLLSSLWLHEPVSAAQWGGVLLMLAAIIFGARSDSAAPSPHPKRV